MIRKYASLESAQVLDLKGSQTRAKTASLEKIGEFEDYRTEDGYLYARIRAISSRVNKNHDGWPSVELAGGKEVFEKHANKTAGFTLTASKDDSYGFSTFLGKPVFVDHNNSNPDRARGVIVDAKLHVEDHKTAAHDPYYSSDDVDSEHVPPTWVELLLEVDAKSFPKLAKAILDGAKDSKKGIDGFSMGCDVEKSVCNICKNAAVSPDEFCSHVKLKGAHFDAIDKHGKKVSKRSYENCYGIKFFEISAVFDPADETALIREVKASVDKELPRIRTGSWNERMGTKEHGETKSSEYLGPSVRCPGCNNLTPAPFDRQAVCPTCGPISVPHPADGMPTLLNPRPQSLPENVTDMSQYRKQRFAEAPLPQADMMTVPEYVDTMREEEVCPVCGSNMDEGHQCDVCGYVSPPEGLDNPDLDQAQTLNAPEDTPQMDSPKDMQQPGPPESPQVPPSPVGNGNINTPNNLSQFASVKDDMAWQIYHPKLAGRINPVERPIRPDGKPGTNEPNETILSDQNTPVTQRTAASMIAAANKENTMGNARTAADAPTADTREQKRVDVTGVGGVVDATNEQASEPTGSHHWEEKGTQTDVTGKGGIIEDSNQEASKPSVGTESLPTAGEKSDDSGFNKEKNIDSQSQRTRTWNNSNEPDSAVTNKSFPTSHQKQAWGDERPFPTEDGAGESSGAKGGAEPADPVGKADERVDLLQRVPVQNPQKGTDQWTGTDGNGVTRQQDPVTRVVDPNIDVKKSSIVALFKIADAEVELGLIEPEQKYDRIAELEEATEDEIQATAKVLARVKTAGLKKNAATRQGGVGRVPSFQTPRTASVTEADESLFM